MVVTTMRCTNRRILYLLHITGYKVRGVHSIKAGARRAAANSHEFPTYSPGGAARCLHKIAHRGGERNVISTTAVLNVCGSDAGRIWSAVLSVCCGVIHHVELVAARPRLVNEALVTSALTPCATASEELLSATRDAPADV